VLVYVITAMHMDKAQKYTDKAVRGAEPYRKLQTSAGCRAKLMATKIAEDLLNNYLKMDKIFIFEKTIAKDSFN